MKVNQPNKNLSRYRKYREGCDLPYAMIPYLDKLLSFKYIAICFNDEYEGVRILNEIEKLPDFKEFCDAR